VAASAKTGSPLVSATQLCKTYGTRVLFDHVSLGLSTGDVVGVVGRNGDGKTTLLSLLTGQVEPDEGRVTRAASASVGVLVQAEPPVPGTTVRDLIVAGQPDHVWASDAESRAVVEHLLAGVDLDARIETLSGGERRRASLVAVILGRHDLVVLDEPTNHLDVQAVRWLAVHLQQAAARGVAILVVSHDRWFLDAVCDHIWEVHDAQVDAYDGGYAAYVLARAERARMAAATQARRRNLLRKELAWLRRGAPARTSKPKFRLDAASQLIEDEPPPRDELALRTLATSRLGKDVLEFQDVGLAWPDTGRAPILDHTDLILGPGDRIGLIGVNGSGKTTVLRLLDGTLSPTSGRVRRGASVRLAHLSQHVAELDDDERVLESVQRLRRQTALATGHDVGTDTLLGDFGFTGDRLVTRIGELSGGERRRLQFLRLLLGEPNVLLLDEPAPAAIPAVAARRTQRAAARRADQRSGHRHADRRRRLPRHLARHARHRQPRPLLPGARDRRQLRTDGRHAQAAARRRGRIPGLGRRAGRCAGRRRRDGVHPRHRRPAAHGTQAAGAHRIPAGQGKTGAGDHARGDGRARARLRGAVAPASR